MSAAIDTIDIKLLWGRAGGRCSAPGCDEDLTVLVEKGAYVVGEMAHVIGRKPSARRGKAEGGDNTYANLILLCPNHHTHIDKAPEGTYPEALLHEWKRTHEANVRGRGKEPIFATFEELRVEISNLLASNQVIFKAFGPQSTTARANPESNLFSIWELRRLDRIIPTNNRMLSLGDANISLMPNQARTAFEEFRAHALAYEEHCYHRLDSYPLFPKTFSAIFSK